MAQQLTAVAVLLEVTVQFSIQNLQLQGQGLQHFGQCGHQTRRYCIGMHANKTPICMNWINRIKQLFKREIAKEGEVVRTEPQNPSLAITWVLLGATTSRQEFERTDSVHTLRITTLGWPDGSASKGTYHQAWWSKFDSQDGREGLLRAILLPRGTRASLHLYKHTND